MDDIRNTGRHDVRQDANFRILIVDDNDAIHTDFRKVLGGAGPEAEAFADAHAALFGPGEEKRAACAYELDSAWQGREALEKVQGALHEDRPYALAFMDVRMPPGWDGIETVERIWQVDPQLQVVLCTAYSDYSWEDMVARLGQTDRFLILKKPFDAVEVQQLAAALTTKWTLSRRAQMKEAELERLVEARTCSLRTEQERALASEQRYRLLAENTTDMITRHAAGGEILYASPACRSVLGREPEEMIGRRLDDLVAEFEQAQTAGAGQSLLTAASSNPLTFRVEKEGGGHAWLEMTSRRAREHAGEPGSEWVCVTRDVSARKETESELIQLQKMDAMGRLAGGIAHDLNNLLTVILAYSEMMVGDLPDESPHAESARSILDGGRRAADLVARLLVSSRKQPMRSVEMDLNSLLSDVEPMFRRLIREDIELIVTLDRSPLWIKGDPSYIEQIVINLITNARDAMQNGGELLIQTSAIDVREGAGNPHWNRLKPGRYACLSVSDTGCGMDEVARERAFDPFYTTKEVGQGTGLGLSIVYGIVTQLGGQVFISSNVGGGTRIDVCFPLCQPRVQREPEHDDDTPSRGGSETVLVVEDESSVRYVAVRVLESAGYTTLSAPSAEAALEQLDEQAAGIDVLLTDVVMPGMKGPELADRVHQKYPDVRILFMSGYTDDLVNADESVATDVSFIRKPFTPAELIAQIRERLDSPAPAVT